MKLFKILVALFTLCLSAFALEDGVEYQTLQKPLNVPQNSIVKVFSYACVHCYKFDRTVTGKLFKALPEMSFIPYHLKTKGALGESASEILAALISLDELNGISLLDDNSKFKKAKFALYKATHDNKDDFGGGKDKARFYKSILGAAGVSKAEFDAASASARAKTILKSWDDSYDVAAVSGVPAYVVGGKYLINLSAAGSIDKMVEIIKELSDK